MTKAGIKGVGEAFGAVPPSSKELAGVQCERCGGTLLTARVDTKSVSQMIAGWLMILSGVATLLETASIGAAMICLGIYMVGGSQKVWACQRCGSTFPRMDV